ncbi:MAG: hypothetical protein AVDCRST_MAG19-2906, partial [uncultured Thermomicrobiales bacterium]
CRIGRAFPPRGNPTRCCKATRAIPVPLARPTPGTLSGSSLRNWTPTPGLGWSLVGREALRQRPRG